MLNNNKSVNNMLSEIVQYMESENIKVNKTNYKLELLNFIAENTLNDWIIVSLLMKQLKCLLKKIITVLIGVMCNVKYS